MNIPRSFLRSFPCLVMLLLSAATSRGQVDLLGMSDLINNSVESGFPWSPLREQVVGQIAQAIGNNGSPPVSGVNNSGQLIGDGLTGATTASANINIGVGVTTNVTWTTTVSWASYTNSDGFVHIQLTVTWGSNSESYTRQIDVKTAMPNETASNGGGVVPVVDTSGASTWRAGEYGHYELMSFPATYGYMGVDGVYYVIGYTQWVWVWVENPDGPGNEYVQ